MNDKKRILCFGDSNTYGYDPKTLGRYDDGHRWVSVMQNELGTEYDVISEGLNGRTAVMYNGEQEFCSGMEYFIPCLMSHNPLYCLIIMLGTNDVCYADTAEEVTAGIEKLIKITRRIPVFERKERIILVSPVTIGAGRDKAASDPYTLLNIKKSEEIISLYKELAEKYEIEFVDANKADCVVLDDFLHLTAQSHVNLGEYMAAHLLEK